MPLLALPRAFHVNSAGAPYGLAKLYHYRAGTLTTLNLYTDATYGTPHAQPIVADANGLFPTFYLNPADGYNLRVILKTSADAAIYDEDNIPRAENSFPASTFNGNITTTGNVFVDGRIEVGASVQLISTIPEIIFSETDRGTDLKNWKIDVQSGVLSIRTRTDADGAGKDIIKATRGSTTAISAIDIGNSTDKPAISQYGKTTFTSALVVSTSEQIPVTAVKTSTTARTSSTTMSNDPHLAVTTLGAGTYRVEVYANVYGTTSGAQGINFNLNFSQTFTFGRQLITGYVNAVSVGPISVPFAATTTATGGVLSQATISTTNDDIRIVGFITTAAAGVFGFSWAQNSSSVNATNVAGGSYMTVTKIA